MIMFTITQVFFCVVGWHISYSNADKVKIYEDFITVINSEVKPGNLLPNFMFQQGSIEGGSVGVNIGGGRGTAKVFD